MDNSIVTTVITSFCMIVVAVITVRGEYARKSQDDACKKSEALARIRAEESRLSMKMMAASLDLGYVTSLAVTGGHTNGNVSAAQAKALKAQEEYECFMQGVVSDKITEC